MRFSAQATATAAAGRIWHFGSCEFDETVRTLRVHGKAVDLEAKPLDVLTLLLAHAGEVVTRDELLDSVWPGTSVVDGSIATAVSKLRKAIGDDDQTIVLTVHRIGYRIAVPVQSRTVAIPTFDELTLRQGDFVPGRDQWRVVRRLDASPSSEVWLAEQPKTLERRIFKFAVDGIRLKGLKREATIARFLRRTLGDRSDFVKVLEWNFDSSPFYIESEYGGQNLIDWAELRGGLQTIPLRVRLDILIRVARAVSVAHNVGVLHRDLKPANILVESADDGQVLNVRVVDFGSASLTDLERLDALGITNLGFTQVENAAGALTGTLMYIAPEILAGQSPSASSDIYALAVLLYQLTVGDFRRPLAPGWDHDIDDPLIREDIGAAACGEPERRLSSAADLAQRLENLNKRKSARAETDRLANRAREAEVRLARWRTRRPWVMAAAVALIAGMATSLVLWNRASIDRDRANRQTAIADSVSRFLAADLLGRGNPFQTGKSDETLMNAIRQASPAIDNRFRNSPEVAARLHQTIARALDSRTAYAEARPEYLRAAELFEKSGPHPSWDAVIDRLQLAAAESRSYDAQSLPRARAILSAQEKIIAAQHSVDPEVFVWLANARGMLALVSNQISRARTDFQEAFDRSSVLPAFDERTRLTFQQRLAFTYIRLGEGAKAEQLFDGLIKAFSRTDGPDSPNALRVRLNLAQAFMIEQKHQQAIAETRRIYPLYLAKLGEDHELSMQVLATQAQSEGSLEMWDDAIRDDLHIHALAVRKQGSQSFFAIASLSDAALAQCRGGRLQEGAKNARDAYAASLKGFGPRAGLTGGAAHTLASCLIEMGRLQEASELLEHIDADAVGQLTGSRNWSAVLALTKADLAFRRHDSGSARDYLSHAGSILNDPEVEPYQKKLFRKLHSSLGG